MLSSELAVCLWIPLFPLRCEERRRPELVRKPTALLSPTDTRRLWQVSPTARRMGVRVGMTVSQSIGLCPSLTLCEPDPVYYDEQFARLLHMAVDYGKGIGFKGKFFIEPKPKEPSTHQYDFDAATCAGFLREFDLLDHFGLNIEANHATLATHTFQHELQVSSDAGLLGSIDVNRGDQTVGWDTDQFPTDLYDAVWAMYIVLRQKGLKYGGLNFDAKVRRGSFDTVDLFHAHIGGMDAFARALVVADRLIRDRVFMDAINGAVNFAKNVMAHNQNHFVHCADGNNRSAAVVLAILFNLNRWTLRRAFERLQSARGSVCPATLYMDVLWQYQLDFDAGLRECQQAPLQDQEPIPPEVLAAMQEA